MKPILISIFVFGIISLKSYGDVPVKFSTDVEEFARAVENNERVLVDFSAHWWGTCQALVKGVWNNDDFQNVAMDKDIKLFYIDFDIHKDLLEKYEVKTIPTWKFINGPTNEIETNTGLAPLKTVLKKINDYFID